MKKLLWTLTLLAGLPLALSAQVSKDDLKKLAAAGISDDVILSYVKANGGVARLSAEDIIELKQAGASEKVLSAALGTAPSAAPAAAPSYTPPATEYRAAPSTTYVYDSSPYYSSYTPTTYVSTYSTPYYYPYYYGSYYYPRYYSTGYCAPRYYSTGYCAPHYSIGFSFGRGFSGVSSYRSHR